MCNSRTVVSINVVACYRTERTLTGCGDPPFKKVDAPHQCEKQKEKKSGMGGVVKGFAYALAKRHQNR